MVAFFWSGFGWLGFVIIAGTLAATEALADSIWGRRGLEKHNWVLIVTWAAMSALCWVVGRWFNRGRPIRVLGFKSYKLINRDETFDGHTTMGVRLEFAGLVFGAIALIVIGGAKLLFLYFLS